jgi:hypothetical protein
MQPPPDIPEPLAYHRTLLPLLDLVRAGEPKLQH